ncbi:MAG: hypothetical protein AAF340_14180 [Pseudomonadota bacterium]
MTTFIANVLATVFRPSIAALAVALALGIASWDHNEHFTGTTSVDITDWSCTGLFKPICRAFN